MKIKNSFSGISKQKKFFFLSLLGIFLFSLPSLTILLKSSGKIFEVEEISHIQKREKNVILVFGAGSYGTKPSDIFSDRLAVAAKLYFENKGEKILVSGDNSAFNYNEPFAGKSLLIQLGVPEKDIILDYAGFSTHDTCKRAKKIFGVETAILVTQKFHLPRSVFFCEQFGIQSQGVSASLRTYRAGIKNILRETLAHQKAFYEVYISHHDPKFLGKQEFIFDETK